MGELKDRLRADLATAMKAKDATSVSTIRMALSAVSTAEVAGDAARELSDTEVLGVLTKEAKKRREAAEAYSAAGRDELAAQELAEGEVLAGYLPKQLGDDELAALVTDAVAQVEAELGEKPQQRQMGQIMKIVQPKVAGRADGSRVAAAVKAALA